MNKKIELLMPAGNLQKLKYTLSYGADAVYIGGKDFSLRARANNFTLEEMKIAAEYAHNLNKKIYVTVNAFIRNNEIEELKKYLQFLESINIDAIIVSDPGVIHLANQITPNLELHLSTQANTTNALSVQFWEQQNIKRIVLARELSIDEIKKITNDNKNLEFEIFIHGAMCISYSGRCFLSAYMINRDANRGDCAHPCRWKYKVFLEEEKRPNQFMEYEEDEKGAYLFNSNDMCQIMRIKELIESGVSSFKIEGRMKSLYYIICITRIYRKAIDLFYENPIKYEQEKNNLLEEIGKLNNRGYTEGFYFGDPTGKDYNYNGDFEKITHYFIAEVTEILDKNKIKVLVKNAFSVGDKIEILTPNLNQENFAVIKNIFSLKTNEYIDRTFSNLEAIIELDSLSQNLKINNFSIIRAVLEK